MAAEPGLMAKDVSAAPRQRKTFFREVHPTMAALLIVGIFF